MNLKTREADERIILAVSISSPMFVMMGFFSNSAQKITKPKQIMALIFPKLLAAPEMFKNANSRLAKNCPNISMMTRVQTRLTERMPMYAKPSNGGRYVNLSQRGSRDSPHFVTRSYCLAATPSTPS